MNIVEFPKSKDRQTKYWNLYRERINKDFFTFFEKSVKQHNYFLSIYGKYLDTNSIKHLEENYTYFKKEIFSRAFYLPTKSEIGTECFPRVI